MRWDIFCRVIDNFGDIGVCWRLGAQLGALGQQVRLWVDRPEALDWLAPRGAPGVQVVRWHDPVPRLAPGDVVIEAFGCDPPHEFVAAMAAAALPPRWINLEYLSAESHVVRSHRLPSPQQHGPGRGLVKHFFYPGFSVGTGGLLREPDLMAQRRSFDRDAWLSSHGWTRRPDERVVVLFCYPGAPIDELVAGLDTLPTLLLLAGGVVDAAATRQRTVRLPWLEQPEFDRLLWTADINFVRGEDSFVRAQWAGAPFVWQVYPQHDDAHRIKLGAFLDQMLAAAPMQLSAAVRDLHQAWNARAAWPRRWPEQGAWQAHCTQWRDGLLSQDDLCTQLRRFVGEPG